MGQSTISSEFQKAEAEVERFQNTRTQTNLERSRNHTIEVRRFLVQSNDLTCQIKTNLERSQNHAIEVRRFLVRLNEALEVRSRLTSGKTPLDSILRELEEQIQRVWNPRTKIKLQRKLNYAAQEARGGTDAYWSQLQMVKEELTILLMNSVKH